MAQKTTRRRKWLVGLSAGALALAVGVGYVINLGISGRGPAAVLVYLQPPIRITDEQHEVTSRDISVSNDGETIRGTVFSPDGGKERPTLVMAHGFNAQSGLLENKARSMAAAGITTVTFDFRGGSSRGSSDGSTSDMTPSSEISDLNAVIDEAKDFAEVDSQRLFLMGESFGGLVAALTAAERDDITGLILSFPALHSADAAREQFDSPNSIPNTVDVGGMLTGRDYWEELWNLDVFDEIKGYTREVIILHGGKDALVDPEYSTRANDTYVNSQLFLVEGAGHGFGGDDAASSLKTMDAFITSTHA